MNPNAFETENAIAVSPEWWQTCGSICYWTTWPVWFLYLQMHRDRARIVLQYKKEVLLVKSWLGDGGWSLPGGGIHKNEPATVAIIRELLEETKISIQVKKLQLIGPYTVKDDVFNGRYVLFKSECDKKPAARPGAPEIFAVMWCPRSHLDHIKLSKDARTALKLAKLM